MKHFTLTLIATTCVVVLMLNSPALHAARYSFIQKGFTGGGIIRGSFEGIDRVGNLDDNGNNIPDGLLTQCSGRGCDQFAYDGVTHASIHFSGNRLFQSFNKIQGIYLTGLVYQIGSNSIEGLGFGTDDTGGLPFFQFYGLFGSIILFTEDDFFSADSNEMVSVSQVVPVPGTIILFSTALLSLFWLNRRKITSLPAL